jgi:hypothetical protein
MMKQIAILAVLLALCAPALAADMPDMVGNWTGTMEGVAWLKNTNWQATGNFTYWEGANTLTIYEQNGTRFVGAMTHANNPMATQVVMGVICSHNDSLTMVSEDGMIWGEILSPRKIEIFNQVVGSDSTSVSGGVFTKE